MLVVACASLTLAALLYVFWLTPEPIRAKTAAEREREYLEEKREVLYENLRDLHLEYRMGKLSDNDYQQMKARYQQELAALLHELEQKGEPEMFAGPPPGLPAEARGGTRGGTGVPPVRPGDRRCFRCGKDNPLENRFCGACGAELPPRETIQ